jgi:hypothetical protein
MLALLRRLEFLVSFRRLGFSMVVFWLVVAGAPGARALTLADLAAGASFAAGSLTFADFEVAVSGDLSLDLADYPVQVLADGFRLSGPLSVLLGDAGTLLLSYTVSAPEAIVSGGSLLAPGTAIGDGAQAWAAESMLDAANLPLASLFTYAVVGVGSESFDSSSFAPVSFVQVAKTLHVASGLFAALPIVEQRFFVVPEPLSLLLLALGIGGLAAFGRRPGARAPSARRQPA